MCVGLGFFFGDEHAMLNGEGAAEAGDGDILVLSNGL